jgi:hypothetical protein
MFLLNCHTPPMDLGTPPEVLGLTDLPILYKAAPTADLRGQLAFDFDVCGVKTAAIPVLNEVATVRDTAAFIAHEAFHQYQSEIFHESDSLPEERYPIQDRTNAALVILEMKLLDAALSGSSDKLRQFIAVRHERWSRNAAVHTFEHYLETHEGTAKYVEAYMREGRASGASDYIASELRRFYEKGAIAAPDLPRNRVYAVGAAIAILLDRFSPSWKSAIAEATTLICLPFCATVCRLMKRLSLAGLRMQSETADTMSFSRRRNR